MRLTCPNCGAQYEVPDQVVPLDGRDVQCSNCGTTWFQTHPDTPDHVAQDADAETPEWEDDAYYDDPAEDDDGVNDDMDDAAAAEMPSPSRPSAVTDVLREEAEREARLRAEEEATGLESQPDLGLDQHMDEAEQHAEEARARIARLRNRERSKPANPEFDPDPVPEDRSGILPDIEEINSSLKSPDKAVAPAVSQSSRGTPAKRPNRFSRGFAVSVLLAGVLLLVYINAPRISEWLPQADPALNTYVAYVDNARLWLDQQLVALTPKPE